MADLTTDRKDPRLGHGVDDEPGPMNTAYLILSDEERAKGWERPYRDRYVHVGASGPKYPLRDLTADERARYEALYVKYEEYPEGEGILGRFWKQDQLDEVGKGCGVLTVMGKELSETYAREPQFYGATYCVGCRRHRPVDEFIWDADGSRVGS